MRYISSIFIMLLGLSMQAQPSLKGIACDSVTGKRLFDARVFDMGNHIIAITDSAGRFTCRFSVIDNPCIRIAMMGYKPSVFCVEKNNGDSVLVCRLIPGVVKLGEFTVTSNYSQNITKQFSMSELSEMQMRENIATSLTDVLEKAPGIVKKAEYHSPIVMRGLSGKRLLVTKDGDRRMGSFPSGFMGQSVNIYALSKVEVMRGPSSVRYGSGAIAGIINLVSRSPFETHGMHTRFETSYGSNNNERNILGGLSWSNSQQAVVASARYREASDFHYSEGAEAKNSFYSDKDLTCMYGLKLKKQGVLTFNSEAHVGGPWGRPIGFNGTDYLNLTNKSDDVYHSSLRYVKLSDQTFTRTEASVFFDHEYRDQLKAYTDIGTKRLSYTEETRFRNNYGGARLLESIKLTEHLILNMGGDGVLYRISTPTDIVDYFLGYNFNNRVAQNAGVVLCGTFAEAEVSLLNERVKIISGLRANYAGIHEGEVHDTARTTGRNEDLFAPSGTLGSVLKVGRNSYLSFNYAHSYRSPDATEMFIESSSGDALLYGNPLLKPEYGNNFDAGFRGNSGAWGWSYDASVYSNFLYNFIDKEIMTGKKGVNYTFVNIGKAYIRGGELALQYRVRNILIMHTNIEWDASMVYTKGDDVTHSKNWFSGGDPLTDIPPFYTRMGVKFARKFPRKGEAYLGLDWLYFGYQQKYAAQDVSNPAYSLLGASAGFVYKWNQYDFALRLKVDNITDNYYFPFESILPGMGRNLKLMLSVIY